MIDCVKRNEIFSAFKHGLSNSEIARLADCSRTTVVGLRKLYDATLDDKENPEALQDLILTKPTYKPREKVYHVLSDEMRKLIDEELEKNAKKTALGQRKQLKKVQDIHNDLCKAGYQVSYSTVTKYVRDRKAELDSAARECFIKQKYVPGQRLEYDWGEVKIFIKGELKSFNMAAVAFCSNGRWARLFTRQDKQAMMEAHVECFHYFGRVPEEMVYDNMRTAVKSFVGEKKPTTELMQLEANYGFRHVFCNVRSGNEKGHVEKSVEVIRRLAFAYRDHFDSLDEANEYLIGVCEDENKKIWDRIQEELDAMRPASPVPMTCFEAYHRNVDKESVISVESNKYSVPSDYVGKSVWVKKYSDTIVVFDTDSKDKMEIARHQRIHGSDQWQLDLQHYLKVLRYKPGAVKNSMALRQSPAELQELFDRYFKYTPKQFIDLLLWARDNNHTLQDLCSSVQVARMKGIRDINVDSLKSVLADCQKMVEVIQMPWTQTIESGSTQNFATLRRLFNTNSQKQS